jgi:hypothetical protein
MVALWMNLAATLRHSLSWLCGRPVLALVMGAVAGPLAYWGGARLGAVELGAPLGSSLAAIAVEWALALPLLAWAAARLPAPWAEGVEA